MNESFKFRTSNTNSQIKFETTATKSSLCDYGDAHIFAKGTIKITGVGADAAARQIEKRNKQVTFKNCTPFTNCVTEIKKHASSKCKRFLCSDSNV